MANIWDLQKGIEMECKWLVERDVFPENEIKLTVALKTLGIQVKTTALSEIEEVGYSKAEYLPYPADKEECVVFYGSLNMMRALMRKTKWYPCGWCNLDHMQCTEYYLDYGKYLLNSNYTMMPLQEVIRQKAFILRTFGVNGEVFIRPNSGFKEFSGRVIKENMFDMKYFDFGFYFNDPSLIVVVSSAKRIEKEWRFVVCDRKAITGSQYKANLEVDIAPGYPSEAFALADKIAKENWQPDGMYTVDICESDGNFYLLEINSFSCSGLYDCDLDIIAEEASKLAIKTWEEAFIP